MFIVSGTYHFQPKRIAFRNDYCLTCAQPRRAVRTRTFDVVHLFWIPILPLGFWKRWQCAVCGKDPHDNPGTSRGFKWVGLFILIFLTAVFWTAPAEPDIAVFAWSLRIAAPIGAVLTFVHLRRTRNAPTLEEKLAGVPSASDTVCPFCGAQLLMLAYERRCPLCGVVRE